MRNAADRPNDDDFRARIRRKRRTMPLAMRNWQRQRDPGDSLL